MTDGIGAGQGVEGILSSSEVTLVLREGLRVDKCQSIFSTDGAVPVLQADL